MTDTTAQPAGTDEAAMHSIADAMRDAAKTASEHAAEVRQSASEVGPKALETISQMFYGFVRAGVWCCLLDGLC